MKIIYKKIAVFILFFITCLSYADSKSNFIFVKSDGSKYDDIDAPEISSLFPKGYLQSLETELTQIYNTAPPSGKRTYYIQVVFEYDFIKLRKNKQIDPQYIAENESKLRKKSFKKLYSLQSNMPSLNGKKPATSELNGVLVHLSFLHYQRAIEKGNYEDLEVYYAYSIATDKKMGSYFKTSMSTFTPTGEIKAGITNQETNKTHLQGIIDAIKKGFEKDKEYANDIYQFGPLTLKIPTSTQTKDSKTKDKKTLYKYTSSTASFDLKLANDIYPTLTKQLTNVPISYYYDDETGTFDEVKIDYSPTAAEELPSLRNLPLKLKTLNLEVDDNGRLKGGTVLTTTYDAEKTSAMLIRQNKGISGDVKYNYVNYTPDFKGNYDFSGIKNINVSAGVGTTNIVNMPGITLNSSGESTINFQNTQPVTLSQKTFDIKIENYKAEGVFSIVNGIKVTSGSATLTLSKMPGISGELKLSLTYNGTTKATTASIITEGTELGVFGTKVADPKLNFKLDSLLNLSEISGTLSLTHSDITGKLTVDNFLYNTTDGIQNISGEGNITYKNFNFVISGIDYDAKEGLKFDASTELKLRDNISTKVEVTEFTIKDKTFTIGSILGKLTFKEFILVDFVAEFDKDGFSGFFKGKIVNVATEGTVIIGKTSDSSPYNYCYLKLEVGNINVPIVPNAVKLTKFGGEVGYNYYIDFEKQNRTSPWPGEPKKNSYLLGVIIELSDVTGKISLEGNAVAQYSDKGLELYLKGTLNVPNTDPWFTTSINALYRTPPNFIIKGGFNTDFKLPKTQILTLNAGDLVDASNLGLDFEFTQKQWYVGRTSMSLNLLKVFNLSGGMMFSGDYTANNWTAQVLGKVACNWNLNRKYSVSIGKYLTVDAAGLIGVQFNAGMGLQITNNGLKSAEQNLNVRANAAFDLSANDVSLTHVKVNVGLAAKLAFNETKVNIKGTGNVNVEVSVFDGNFDFDIDYEFTPGVEGSGKFTGNTSSSFAIKPENIKNNFPSGSTDVNAKEKIETAQKAKKQIANSTCKDYGNLSSANVTELTKMFTTMAMQASTKLSVCKALSAIGDQTLSTLFFTTFKTNYFAKESAAPYSKCFEVINNFLKSENKEGFINNNLTEPTVKEDVVLETTEYSDDAVADNNGDEEETYTQKVTRLTDAIDLVIHGENEKYWMQVNGKNELISARTLATWLKNNGMESKKIRLLTCASLTSAQSLANKLNTTIIATDGYVRIHADGGITTLARTGTGTTDWYECKPGNTKTKITAPTKPQGAAVGQYVQMGGDGKVNLEEQAKNLIIVAIPLQSENITKFATDPATIAKVVEMIKPNSTFRKKIGINWEQELKDILGKNSDLKCGTCGKSGLANLPTMDEMLDNLSFISQFADKAGFESILTNLKSNTNNRDGVNHMLGYIKKNEKEFENIIEFEFEYSDEFQNKADVLVGNVKYEFKSWTPNTANPWESFFSGSGNSYTQFTRYLQNTTDLDNLKYIFNGTKATESQVKTAFKSLFTNKKTEIFEVIWNNQSLRKDLFGNRAKANAENYFLNLIDGAENYKLFNFIKSE